VSLVAFPYTLHKGYAMPIIPVTILTHKIWVFVDSGATFTVLGSDEAHRLGIDWQRGRRRMMVVGDGSFIPIYMHDLSIHIDAWEITAPVGFSERLGVGFNLLGRTGVFNQFQVCFNDRTYRVTLQKL
jgi:predicted aspartyl protease